MTTRPSLSATMRCPRALRPVVGVLAGAALALGLAAPALGQSAPLGAPTPASLAKSASILGGPSRLAALLANQGAATPARDLFTRAPLAAPPAFAADTVGRDAVSATRPDIFRSVALDLAHSPLDARWRQVAHRAAGPAAAALAARLAGLPAIERLAEANRFVNARVRFVDDKVQFGIADRWSSGAETLARGRGDCEDYAIAKLQILRAAGIAERDLYLSIVRDLVRRQDHAVLVVRVEGRFWVLDNGTDQLLSDRALADYRPVLTFTSGRLFSHGYRRDVPAAAPVEIAALQRSAPLQPAAATAGPDVAATGALTELFVPSLALGSF